MNELLKEELELDGFDLIDNDNLLEFGQFCGNRSLIKKRRMSQATIIILLDFIFRDIPCYI